jgi:hypothetical protein
VPTFGAVVARRINAGQIRNAVAAFAHPTNPATSLDFAGFFKE